MPVCVRVPLRAGTVEALQWAREHDYPWNAMNACAAAAAGGHLLEMLCGSMVASGTRRLVSVTLCWVGTWVLRWAREHDCPWNAVMCRADGQEGHLAVLRWAWEHHFVPNSRCRGPPVRRFVGGWDWFHACDVRALTMTARRDARFLVFST